MVTKRFTVAVLGAAGGIGQPCSLLLSLNEDVSDLRLYDVVPVVEGVAKDISHINKNCNVTGYAGDLKNAEVTEAALSKALTGVDVVIIPAGLPRKPGMSRDDLFAVNAGIVQQLITAVAKHCPSASICIISNPVNSTVPIAAEVLKLHKVFNPKKLYGVSTLDVVRANKFVGEVIGKDPNQIEVTVIGGHSGVSILPLLSSIKPKVNLSKEQVEQLTSRIQNAGTEVVEAKKGGGSATLSMAFAAARFAASVMKGLKGESNVVECSYVFDPAKNEFFAWPVELGKNGINKILVQSNLSEYEAKLLSSEVKAEIKNGVDKGVQFVQSKL